MLVYGVYNSWSFAKLHEFAPTPKHRNMPMNLPVKNMDVFQHILTRPKTCFQLHNDGGYNVSTIQKVLNYFRCFPKKTESCLMSFDDQLDLYTSTIDGLLTCINVNMVYKIMQHMSPDCAPHTNKHCSHLLNSKTGYIISVFSPGKLW